MMSSRTAGPAPFHRMLIANRGEVAVRIARAAGDLGVETVAVFSIDDAGSGHSGVADYAAPLTASGPRAYLDAEAIIAQAVEHECDAVHPGYGFLSENAAFARLCAERGLVFIGPHPRTLDLFGDKARARSLAREAGISVPRGVQGAVDLDEARSFFASLGGSAVMVKAVAGGGGRGMRPARSLAELEAVFDICRIEAEIAFGSGALYLEELVDRARHIEVQVVGDAAGGLIALGDRDCSAQRQRQKLIELAPAQGLSDDLRARLHGAAVRLGLAASYDNIGTVEFLLNLDVDPADDATFVFIEANPRLQVEHTITEEVTGIDLVQTQILLSAGRTLGDLGLTPPPVASGAAVQVRINAETPGPDGALRASGGRLKTFAPPSGPGVRVDTFVRPGMTLNPGFDSLLAKVILRGPDIETALRRARRALKEFDIVGPSTNRDAMRGLLERPELGDGRLDTGFVEREADALARLRDALIEADGPDATGVGDRPDAQAQVAAPPGTLAVPSPLSGLVVDVSVTEGEAVWAGRPIALLEAMKMQHVVTAPFGGVVRALVLRTGDIAVEGRALLFLEPAEVAADVSVDEAGVDIDHIRDDLAHMHERVNLTLDPARPEAVARRHGAGMRTARENLDDLFDPGSFHEYGGLAIAAQRRRRGLEDLLRKTPADGLVGGVGAVNGELFDETRSRCMAMAYDYTVLAGTQGYLNHKKTDRLIRLAHEMSLPIVLFAEGGGGRPGDTDPVVASALDTPTFSAFARLSGVAPRIGVVAGRCFAGNAVLYGCCDLTIATRNANIGLGGPAMIEGGGLGVFRPEDVGPIEVQTANGVVDLAVKDEVEAVRQARRMLSYFQGSVADWTCADQRLLRQAVPSDRLRVYDVRTVIDQLADDGSVLELRRGFGPGMVTALIRIEGRPMGLIANDPRHLGGAIDSDGADKAARFMQLCDAYDLPIVSLCDTPGFMVGPESERTAAVRHGSRMFIVAGALRVPVFTVVLRKGYGLGAQAMSAGGFHEAAMTVSWPSGEFGAMGLEGAVKLAFRKELEAIDDADERARAYAARVADLYELGRATTVAQYVEIDAVIDPAETRSWLSRGLKMRPAARAAPRRYIDAW